ncbi:UNVERIFIED_CONTAM: 50S ribosomal protein L21, mitochondrial [Sesamum indicum]
MANRRCFQTLTRYFHSIKSPTPLSQILAPTSAHALRQTLTQKLSRHIFGNKFSLYPPSAPFTRHFSSRDTDKDGDDDEDDESEEEEEESGSENERAVLSAEDKENDAAEIGYKVIGPLQKLERVFKPYEPVFAVVQIGSHQFKVSNGDTIYTERLKYCDVNDKALDAKVIIFKKKRRKNYRRTKGHRQELTKLRITDIQGIEKPEKITPVKMEKKEKLAVGA